MRYRFESIQIASTSYAAALNFQRFAKLPVEANCFNMPMYEYLCANCGKRFELIQKFVDAPLTVHEECGGGPVERLISAPALQFKGTGWYVTDYAKGNGSGANSGTESKGKSESSGEGSKPEGSKSESSQSDSSKSEGSKSQGGKPEGSRSEGSKSDSSSSGNTSSASSPSPAGSPK